MDTVALSHALSLSLPESLKQRAGSVATSASGASYAAGRVGSQTHLLDIPSELAALVRAVHANDCCITEVATLAEGASSPSPLVLKILADHGARTGLPIRYSLRDAAGTAVFETPDARAAIPAYRSPLPVLASLVSRRPDAPKRVLAGPPPADIERQLRDAAVAGCARNFPTREGASGYGAAVLTAEGMLYFGGQYSDPGERLGVHAEMAVLLNVLMDGARNITHIGIASSKFPDTPASPCGACRQFIAEMSRAYGFSPKLCVFASAGAASASYTLPELLPVQWSNKK